MSTFAENAPVPIKELLIEATFAPNRALRSGVDAIDLGVLGQEAERINDKSANGDGIEYIIPAVVTPDRRLLLRKEEISGGSGRASYVFETKYRTNYLTLPKEQRQELFLAVGIHNHPVPMPLSPDDLGYLFLDDTCLVGQTAAFVSSPIEKMVIFRGANTPGWTMEFSKQKVGLWIEMLERRIYQFLRTKDEMFEINRKVQMAFLRDLICKYDLQAFSCPLRENIARRMTFSPINPVCD